MGRRLEMIHGGLDLLVATGVSILVGSAIGLVKPGNLGAIKKVAAGIGGFAISCMAVDGVTDYVDNQWNTTVEQVKKVFHRKPDEEEKNDEKVEEA